MLCNNTLTSISMDKIKLQRDLLLYISKYNIIPNIEHYISLNFSNIPENTKKYLTLILPIEIDIQLANDISSELPNTLIKNPIIFKIVTQEIIYSLICNILDTNQIQQKQIITTIIPKSIVVDNIFHIKGLSSFQGVLMGHSELQKYILNTVWECSYHNETPVFFEGLPCSSPKCELCGHSLMEQVKFRKTDDFIICLFVHVDALNMTKYGRRYQAREVKITNINTSTMELGDIYNIIGVKQTNFDAWNCEKYIYRPVFLANNEIKVKFSNYLSTSPWQFVYILASKLAKDYYPEFAFINLKIGLLLSLASLNERNVPIPILVCGKDTLVAHHLFDCASRYAARCVYTTSGSILSGQKYANNWYEAGSLLLSKGGVCYIGDWEKYTKEKDGFIIRSAIESNQINMGNRTLPLRSTVWTYWSKSLTNKNKTELQTLINIFGIPFISDADDEEYSVIDSILSKHEADNSVTSNNNICFNDGEMQQFLLTINQHIVTLTKSAQKLLKDYFVASRRVRPGCLPVGALGYLTGLSEAHARLSLRNEVIIEDVIAVISLYEDSMQTLFGCANIAPTYIKNISNINQIDEEFKKFSSWLNEFVSIV